MKYLAIFILLISDLATAQTSIPRDTSFTIYSTYLKERKSRPYIQIAEPVMPPGVKSKENIVYSKIGKRKLLADVFFPAKKSEEGYPAVVMVFGGGWKSGDKSQNIPIAQQLAANGYVAVTIEYRLSPEAQYPAAVYDVKAAIRWLRANAEKYNVDATRIATMGMSAGGQLATLVGTTNSVKKFEGSRGNAKQSSNVQAIVNIDGTLAFKHPESAEGKVAGEWLGGMYNEKPENWIEAAPLTHVGKGTPPILFINSSIPRFHAGRDDMIKKLNEHGIYSQVHTLDDTPHPFWFFHPWFQPTVNYTLAFLDKVFKGKDGFVSVKPVKKYDFIVAPDGSGNFKTIQEAINAVPDFRKKETVILIKNGTYKEKLILAESKTLVTFIGESVDSTIITYDDWAQRKNIFGEEKGTSGSSGFYIYAPDFSAENITFQNTAGPVGQAVAVFVAGDRVKFRNCRFLGFQDTLYTWGRESRQYYNNCYIEGTVDFIFGSSTAVFDSCTIFGKRGGFYTAASTPENKSFGYVFLNCNITGDAPPNSFYLGRPWRPYAKTVFIKCRLSKQVKPEGWDNWGKAENETTTYYAEYKNFGEGATIQKRVRWSHQLTDEEAKLYTLKNIFKDWDPFANKGM